MRAWWLAIGAGALLVLAMAQGLAHVGGDGELVATSAERYPAREAVAAVRGALEGGSVLDEVPLDLRIAPDAVEPSAGATSPQEAALFQSHAGQTWVQRLTSIDGLLDAMGVGIKAAERMQLQLEAVHAAYDQPFDPVPWAERPVRTGDQSPPSISASAAVVLDEASAAVLYGKNHRERLPPASTTKIATLILAVEHGRLDDELVSSVDGGEMPGSSLMGLRRGDRFVFRDVLYGLMLPSGNDAALAVGRHIAGSDEAFMEEIDRLLKRLRLEDTKFIDPHGLGRGGGHYSTAVDMALLARYGMQMPEFVEIVSTPAIRIEGSRTLNLRNTNQFLTRYPGADGVKTGFTYAGGPTFVGSAVRDGQRLYVVLLNSGDRPGEAAKLLDWAFDNHEWPAPLDAVVDGSEQSDAMEDVLEAASSR